MTLIVANAKSRLGLGARGRAATMAAARAVAACTSSAPMGGRGRRMHRDGEEKVATREEKG